MKKIISLLTISTLIALPAFAENEINFDLSSHYKSSLNISNDYPELFKPSGLVIGNSTMIKIKADAGSYVSLVTSFSNTGVLTTTGNTLRLGDSYQTINGTVPVNGLLEIAIKLDNDKSLLGKDLYVEALVWKNQDKSDLKLAKIIGVNGREADSNAITIKEPAATVSGAGFSTSLPGFSQGMMETINKFESAKQGPNQESEKLYDSDYYQQKSVILRNLHSPEVEKTNE